METSSVSAAGGIGRRAVLTAAGCAGVALGAGPARAQAPRPKRIGLLADRPPTDPRSFAGTNAAWEELKRLGWEEGRNLVVERRYAMGDAQAWPRLAAELVDARVDVIFAPSDPAAAAAYAATRTVPIPIVMMGLAAVEPGYAASLARPGGNVTGVVYMALDFIGKELGVMRALNPRLQRIGLTGNPPRPLADIATQTWRNVAASAKVAIVALPDLNAPADLPATLAAAERERIGALLVGIRFFLLGGGWREIRRWAIEHRVTTHSGTWARGEVLTAFGPSAPELRRAVMTQIDRILRGANPADLPIQQPSQFELIVSREIANAMGLVLPAEILASATEVIG